jgi:outer membrane autotransporter protein
LELEALRVGAQINESKGKAQFDQERAGVELGIDIAKSKAQERQQAIAAAIQRSKPGTSTK